MSFLLFLGLCNVGQVEAATTTHTVQKGDSLWKIAVRYQVGITELIQANKQIPNINLIYPIFLRRPAAAHRLRASATASLLVRAIDRPAEIDALPDCKLILSAGPFSLADERALMRNERVKRW